MDELLSVPHKLVKVRMKTKCSCGAEDITRKRGEAVCKSRVQRTKVRVRLGGMKTNDTAMEKDHCIFRSPVSNEKHRTSVRVLCG